MGEWPVPNPRARSVWRLGLLGPDGRRSGRHAGPGLGRPPPGRQASGLFCGLPDVVRLIPE
eukprot:5210413-Alexandrium_andersonii.AAC.1